MNHVYLPQKIWKLLDKNFQIVEDIEFLEEKFPKNFLNYVEYYVGHEGFIRFEYFRRRGAGEENVDGYLDGYFAVKKKADRNEFRAAGRNWTTWQHSASGIPMRRWSVCAFCSRSMIWTVHHVSPIRWRKHAAIP